MPVSLTELLGERHPLALVCAVNLASDVAALGQHDEARQRSENNTMDLPDTFGEDHPITLAYAGNLALDLIATGAEAEGRALREDSLERMEHALDAPRIQGATQGCLRRSASAEVL